MIRMIAATSASTSSTTSHGLRPVVAWARRGRPRASAAAARRGPGVRRRRHGWAASGRTPWRRRPRVAQRGGEGVAVGVPLRRAPWPCARRTTAARSAGTSGGQVRDRVVEVGQGGRDRRVGVEGPVAGQALEGHARRASRRRRRASRCAPRACSGERYCGVPITWPVCGQAEAVGGAGDAEVGDLHLPVGRDQQVGRLHVAVHDAGRVRGADRVGGLGDQVADHARGRSAGRRAAAPRAAGRRRAPSRGTGAAGRSRPRAEQRGSPTS